ncbi:hypothetical protein J132_09651 [Termitomyces sp. J132]|nr:hypothetical protein H2248_009121 [Termitomyces sp. 'cryptogamus']KNZ73749.1 hypothetical protein J132_09651 [Termitomyces sp. J132]
MAAQAATAAPKASLFPELLRRSKFATYDPAIRQTYQAPPANAHRGDWGLKRPISLRRRNAFISLTSFEHHAHFTEWNHAENQVRFIRRLEEMGGRVEMNKTTPWYKSLGIARFAPPLDSDFCPGEIAEFGPPPTVQPKLPGTQGTQPKQTETQATQGTVDLNSLGKRGPGAYGTQREESHADWNKGMFVTRNIYAMSSREFDRYLRSLRAQRSDFQEFVNAEKTIKNKDLGTLGMEEDNLYYRQFLQSQMKKEYADYDGQRIEPQPHPNGAAQYSKPTRLETLLWTQDKPGFYLNNILDSPKTNNVHRDKNFVVSFGGITTRVDNNVVVGKNMLLDKTTDQGVKLDDIEGSILRLRLNPSKPTSINRLPLTVGNRPEGLKAVRLTLEVIKGDALQMGWSNPHPLGSPEYIAMFSDSKKLSLKAYNHPSARTVTPLSTPDFDGERSENSDALLGTLKHLVGKQNNDRL